ncbi:effector-associated domain 2-containing protein [Streptomyces radicis]|uniref:phosphorylase family protein n=1 Tax=Streptomyces radicis TaxID=1750517 RepID=UPI00160350E2|nr:hypothetical protein [Streptomyces radicis]
MDVVVLTALEVEYRAVRAHLERTDAVVEERGSRFEVGVARGGADEGRVAIHMVGPGNPAAAALIERAVTLFAPRTVLFVGVGGGRKDVALGDVVAGDEVYDYETGKDTAEGFLPRQKTHRSGHRLVQHARSVVAADRWQDRIDLPVRGRPRAYVKPIAAGGRVITSPDSQVARALAASAGDALAVDMEGYGFLAGAHLNPHVDALVIRGISDLLGDKGEAHDERWQPVAAGNAAAFAFELIAGLSPARGSRATGRAGPPVAAAPRPPRLTIEQLGDLADLLLAVPGLASPSRWQQLLDELPSVGTAVQRQPTSRAEALALLRSCDDHGAWGDLFGVLGVLAPGAPALDRLDRRAGELGLR